MSHDPTDEAGPAFAVLPPSAPPAPVLVHVPHASCTIPADVRRDLVLDDAALARELLRLTDHRTDVLAAGAAAHGATRFVNRRSRLVVDPERFPDEREELAARGMAAVYTRTHDLQPLRTPSPADERVLLDRYFEPYAAAFAEQVGRQLDAHGACTIVDLHSYPTQRLPYELHAGPRPPLCVGTDATHTPRWLVDLVVELASAHGLEVALDTPFAGTYVPLDRHGTDPRVTSVMLELRRDTYLDEATATPHAGEPTVAAFVAAVAAAVARHHEREATAASGDPAA
jgi:N-formylglutamate deformylase